VGGHFWPEAQNLHIPVRNFFNPSWAVPTSHAGLLSQHLMLSQHPNLAVPTSQSCCPNISVLLSQHLSLAVQHLSLAVPTSHAGLLESSSPLAGSPKDKVREVSGMKHRNQEELRKHKETCLPFTIWLIESSSLARIPQG
jgi:hypothetical protein